MLLATAVAVVDKLVVNATEPDMTFTPSIVIESTEPLAPPVKVTVAVAAAVAGVLLVITELLRVPSIVNRSR